MPQLDQVTFLTQFFWVSIFFFAFYLINIQRFLPKIASSLKIRQKYGSQIENLNYNSNTDKITSHLKTCSQHLSIPSNINKISTQSNFLPSYFNRLGFLSIVNKQIYPTIDMNFAHSCIFLFNVDPNFSTPKSKSKSKPKSKSNVEAKSSSEVKSETPTKKTKKRKKTS